MKYRVAGLVLSEAVFHDYFGLRFLPDLAIRDWCDESIDNLLAERYVPLSCIHTMNVTNIRIILNIRIDIRIPIKWS